MKTKRITAFLAALSCAAQCIAGLPVEPAAALQTDVSWEQFAASVQKLLAHEVDQVFYSQIDYHKNTGLLYVDGISVGSEYGELSVQDDALCVQNDQAADAASEGGYSAFEEAASERGYAYTVHGDTLTLTNEFQTARLIVKAAGKLDSLGAVSSAEGYRDLHIFQYADAEAAFSAYQQFKADPRVQYVQPSHIVKLCDAELQGLDDHNYNTWGTGAIGADDFYATWLKGKTLPEVKVAVIDTGINDVHSIFDGRIAEGGINISDSGDDSIDDDLGHGTHCTGTICELTPDNVKVLPIKIFDKEGKAADEQIYLGMVYAMEQGAQIASMSFGGLGVSPLEIEACELANANGMLCVAAAGNESDDAAYYYPGSIESCVTVGAVDENMQRAPFSNFGKLVDVVAPGVGIVSYTTGEAERTEKMSGTSMATPHVSACCALLKSYDVTLPPDRIENLLKVNAKDLGEVGFDEDTAWGLVNLRDFRWDDGICCAPVFSEESGNFGSSVTVELTTETAGAAIYYTTDGSLPTKKNGMLYSEPVTITETTQLIAVAVKDGFVNSAPAEAAFSIGGKDVPDAVEIRDGVLVKYHGVRKNLTVPEAINGETITAIGEDAFAGNRYLTQIILPESVKTIGDRAFADCRQLANASAYGVTEIGTEAFKNCGMLESVSFASSVSAVGASAFAGDILLKSLKLDGITAIPDDLCNGCAALERISAKGAKTVGERAFYQCALMKAVTLDWEQVTALGALAFSGCAEWEDDLPLYHLEKLGESVFSGARSLLRVSLPESFTVLPSNTFQGCSGLRLLQLPGITKLKDHALALRSTRADLVTELDYSRITDVEEGAFFGFRIGNDNDITEFTSLKEIRSRAFAGVAGGGLAFPAVTAVPDHGFAGCSLRVLYLENVQSLGADSLTGCASAVVSAALKTIVSDAWTEGMWIVTQDQIPALAAFTNYQLCMEPLVLMNPEQNVQVRQHHAAALKILAGGVDMHYQWFTVQDGKDSAIADSDSPVFYADTSEPGEKQYRCIMTDREGKIEKVLFTVHTEDAGEIAVPETEKTVFPDTDADYLLTVPETGEWTICAYGAAWMNGTLCTENGIPAASFAAEENGTSVLRVHLEKGQNYYLSVQRVSDTKYSLLCTKAFDQLTSMRLAEITLKEQRVPQYGAAYEPEITVTLPDGTVLKRDTDYAVSVAEHNQERTISVFGTGRCCGYAETSVPIYPHVPADTPIPVSLRDKEDKAVYCFVPRESGTYYYYATTVEGYAEEEMMYRKRGNYGSGSKYVNIRTNCAVCDSPDGRGVVFSENSFNALTGNYFCGTVDLSAGQAYYFRCGSESEAAYALVISQECRNLRDAMVTGELYAMHRDGKTCSPEIRVTLNGTELTEGVDFQQVDIDSDLPGEAVVKIVGMGVYTGNASRQYRIIYTGRSSAEQKTELDMPVKVECTAGRTERIWFEATGAGEGDAHLRYRVLNERISGGRMDFDVFRYNADAHDYFLIEPMKGATASNLYTDYELTDGTYCVVVHRVFANVAAAANITVLKPYSLNDADITVHDAVYTGEEVTPDMEVFSNGELLIPNKDFTVGYPDGNILFGEVHYNIKSNKRSYGHSSGMFEIKVVLPEDAPVITVGEYEAQVTFEKRLAVYRVCPTEETTYLLASPDVMDTVLRVFSPDAVMLGQAYGAGSKSLSFTVPAGETRYIMVKFNGTERMGTLHFQLETSLRLLSACEAIADPVSWTGERVLPDLQFRDGDYVLEEGKDYRIRYSYNDINPGVATVNCVGMGDYFGNVDVDYQIILPKLFELENYESFPIALGVDYGGKEETECPYLIYRYTAGTETALHLDVVRSAVKLNVQRYDSAGHWQESMLVKPDGFMEFTLKPNETVYFLLSATDVSGWNMVFHFELTALHAAEFRMVEDTEHGVTYRVLKDNSYAEVYALDTKQPQVILLPEIDGVPVKFITEGLFTVLPEEAVVVGYSGCSAAMFADRYGFAYQEPLAGIGDPVQGDLNGDGRFTIADAVLFSRVLAEQTNIEISALNLDEADMNKDGCMDIDDMQTMLAMLAGKTE